MIFKAFSIDKDTKGVMVIEEKGTGPNPGLLSTKQADQSSHPERTAYFWFCVRKSYRPGGSAFSVHKNFLNLERSTQYRVEHEILGL